MRRVSEIDQMGGACGAVFSTYDDGAVRSSRLGGHDAPALFGGDRVGGHEALLDRPLDRSRWLTDHVVPHEPWLRRWLQRRCSDQDVEDIVQESYALLIQAERVDHVRHPRNYFCQTARSVILRKARRDAIVRFDCTDAIEMRDFAADQPLADHVVAARQELRLVLHSLERLPKRTRDVFLLRRIENLSLIATAAHLGISQSAVEKHLRAALRALAQYCGRGLPDS